MANPFYFKRESKGAKFKTKQYIHIASVKEIKEQIKEEGFDLIYYGVGLSQQTDSKPMFFEKSLR